MYRYRLLVFVALTAFAFAGSSLAEEKPHRRAAGK